MGGFWQLVFACCLLVQSLSAEDLVKNNSTSAVKNNSTSAVKYNSTSVVKNNSTSAVKYNSTSAVKYNSTSAVKGNSTSAAKGNSTSAEETIQPLPDEELEKNIGQRIASLREMGQDEIRRFADLALQDYNTREPFVFTTWEEPTVMVKKAIGSMMYLRMTLEKTNCTKKDVKLHSHFRFMRHFESEGEPPKYCGPLDGEDKKVVDCKFDIFRNDRSYGEAIMGHDCKPLHVIDKDMLLSEITKS